MIIYTTQHKDFLKNVPIEIFDAKYKNLYDKLFKKLGIDGYRVIWGWYKRFGTILGNVSDKDAIDLVYGTLHCPSKDTDILVKLDISENNVKLVNYYEWTDLMFFTEEGDDGYTKEEIDNLIKHIWEVGLTTTDPKEGNVDCIQALCINVSKDNIVKIF